WDDTRVTPALIRWRILRGITGGQAPWKTAVDFRSSLMPSALFNLVYAPGTRQNRAGRPGNYNFYLRQAWRSTRLRDGPYRLQVAAFDSRRNSGASRLGGTRRRRAVARGGRRARTPAGRRRARGRDHRAPRRAGAVPARDAPPRPPGRRARLDDAERLSAPQLPGAALGVGARPSRSHVVAEPAHAADAPRAERRGGRGHGLIPEPVAEGLARARPRPLRGGAGRGRGAGALRQ